MWGNTRPVRGVQAPAPAWAINRSGFGIWAINGTGWGKATLSTTTPVAGHHCGDSTIQQYESLAVQQVLRAWLRPPRASVGGPTGSAGRCCHGEVYTTSRSCQVIGLPGASRHGRETECVCISIGAENFPTFSLSSCTRASNTLRRGQPAYCCSFAWCKRECGCCLQFA